MKTDHRGLSILGIISTLNPLLTIIHIKRDLLRNHLKFQTRPRADRHQGNTLNSVLMKFHLEATRTILNTPDEHITLFIKWTSEVTCFEFHSFPSTDLKWLGGKRMWCMHGDRGCKWIWRIGSSRWCCSSSRGRRNIIICVWVYQMCVRDVRRILVIGWAYKKRYQSKDYSFVAEKRWMSCCCCYLWNWYCHPE